MKTAMSRFHIHDELTAPEASTPVLKGALTTGGQLPNFLGVLAGSPAAIRAYARFRSELRHGTLDLPTVERIALAVADHYGSQPGLAMHSRMARTAGLGLDEVELAREFDSGDERQAALLRYLKAVVEEQGRAPLHLHEEARGLVARRVIDGPPVRVEYALTDMGHELEPALAALKHWARRWLRQQARAAATR